MNNKKLLTILEAVATIVLGVLIAIFGIGTLNVYFGVVLVISAAAFLAIAIIGLSKTGLLSFGATFSFTTLLTFGIVLLLNRVSLGYIFYLLAFLVVALGGALAIFGVFTMVKFNLFYGLGQLVLGALAIVVGILYLTVPEFHVAFWIIVGVLVSLYGVLLLITAITNKKLIETK